MWNLFTFAAFWRDDMSIGLLFEPRDLWVGVYWTDTIYRALGIDNRYHETTWREVYICLVPCLPIKLLWKRPVDRVAGRLV